MNLPEMRVKKLKRKKKEAKEALENNTICSKCLLHGVSNADC